MWLGSGIYRYMSFSYTYIYTYTGIKGYIQIGKKHSALPPGEDFVIKFEWLVDYML